MKESVLRHVLNSLINTGILLQHYTVHKLCNWYIWKLLCQEMNQGTRTLTEAEQKLNVSQAFALYQPVQPSKESLSVRLGLIVLVSICRARGLNSINSKTA